MLTVTGFSLNCVGLGLVWRLDWRGGDLVTAWPSMMLAWLVTFVDRPDPLQ